MSDEQAQTGVNEATVSPAEASEDVAEELEQEGEVSELESPASEEAELTKSAEEYERENAGLKATMLAERERRQQAEREKEYLLQGRVQPQQPVIDDDQYVQMSDVKKFVNQVVGQKEQQFQAENTRTSLDLAKTKYGSEFDTAMKLADELSLDDPALTQYVLNSSNKGEAIMKVARMHPEWGKKQQAKAAQGVAGKIARNSKQPKTLSDAGGAASPAMTADKIKNMSDAEFDELQRKIEGY